MKVKWVPRVEWGANTATELFIKKRITDPPEAKTEIQVHHTAGTDVDDSTPNRWDYDEAITYMKRLEWVRPDLGPLPYSENVAVSEDLATVWVFEGRGITKRGAHTGGHNVPGVGWGVLANFDMGDVQAAAAALKAIESQAQMYRDEGLINLGNVKNPRGWDAWGHRDSSSKSCPGHALYPLLEDFDIEGENMRHHPSESFGEFVKIHDIGKVPSWSPWDEYVDAGGSSVQASGTWAFARADIAWFWKRFVDPLVISNRSLLARVKVLELKVAALELAAPPSGGEDSVARASATRAHQRLDGIDIPN